MGAGRSSGTSELERGRDIGREGEDSQLRFKLCKEFGE